MRFIKRKLAMVLAVLLMVPAQPVLADNTPTQSIVTETSATETKDEAVDLSETETTEENEIETEVKATQEESKQEGKEESKKETEESAKELEESEKNETEESDKGEEESKNEVEESVKEPEKAEEPDSESKSESKSKDMSEADSESNPEEEKFAEQIVSAVRKNIKRVANSQKKELPNNQIIATPSKIVKAAGDEVKFNTGNHVYTVVSKEDFLEKEIGDAFFEEDGSFTINIPEENPFFPYEVQFTYKGKTVNEWFMTPNDSLEIGGHTFFVSAYFDGTVVTQMSLDVAGETVIVYPKKKEFTDEDEGIIDPTSLLPLERKWIYDVDLTGFTPIELTMVSFSDIFKGENQLSESTKVVWSHGNDKYVINSPKDKIDLSLDTVSGFSYWTMIVGEDDQLAADNIKYQIEIKVTRAEKWLIPTLYKQDNENNRVPVTVLENTRYYDGGNYDGRYMGIWVPYNELKEENVYAGFEVDTSLFERSLYDQLKVYKGNYSDYRKAESEATEITEQIFPKDMTKADIGYILKEYEEEWITMVAYASGEAIGCLPFELHLNSSGNGMSYGYMYEGIGADRQRVSSYPSTKRGDDGYRNVICRLYEGVTVDKEYYYNFEYIRFGKVSPESVTAAYVGKYSSIEEAVKAGATDIKESLFDQSDNGGYKANYSKGIYFSIFVGEDKSEEQEVYKYYVKAEGYVKVPSTYTGLNITGFIDRDGNEVNCYIVDGDEDTYGAREITILVDESIDLTYLKPVFLESSATVHVDRGCIVGDSSSDVVSSGNTPLNFSKGPVQFTVFPEDTESENRGDYWLQVVKRTVGSGNLYINTLGRENAETSKDSNGVIHSTREMFIDSRYGYKHDILLINTGTEALANLDVEVVSDEVELDPYWTLKGKHELAGFSTEYVNSWDGQYGYLSNMAKLRFQLKDGVDDGREITGTLTIKSGSKTLMVLNLTGVAGDPGFRTKEIPIAVKYIPYGAAIQVNNYYQEWNTISFELVEGSGSMPEGMELKPRGEIYGTPKEMGVFSFTIRMTNSFDEFQDRERTFTLTVVENTDANIETITDDGYQLSDPIHEVALNSTEDQTLVSKGVLEEFQKIFLDGELLQEGVDYTKESGSTRITIRNQTLKASNKTGTHTLGIEFREGGDPDKQLRASGQNYVVTTRSSGNNSGNNSSGGNSSGSSSGSSDSGTSKIDRDAKKGYVHADTGIITGDKSGYSHWQQDENGWKLVYANGTMASGYMTTLENGETVEQIIWEKINGSWYAFGVDGYIKTGWVYDYRLGSWYSLSADTGMLVGWYTDPVDQNTYYLDPIEGRLSTGWRNIERKWYYFNNMVAEPTWELNKETNKWQYNAKSKSRPFGALLRNEKTPDGYEVNADGVWIEKQ